MNDTSTFSAQEENWKRNGFTVAQVVTKKTDALEKIEEVHLRNGFYIYSSDGGNVQEWR